MAPRKRGRVISQVGTIYHDRDERRLVRLPGNFGIGKSNAFVVERI